MEDKLTKKEIQRLPVMGLEVTDVKIYPFDTTSVGGNVKAVATITINGVLKIKDIKIVESNNGLFIQMPSKKSKSGEFIPVVDLENRDFYLHIRRKIIDTYEEELNKFNRMFSGDLIL